MAKALLTEAREILLLISMLMALSIMSLAVACGALVLADRQAMSVAALANHALGPVDR